MRKKYARTQFKDLLDRNSGRIFSQLEFQGCQFSDISLSVTNNIRLRSQIRDVKLVDCTINNCKLNSAIIEEVVVNGLKTQNALRANGAVFKHVILKGRIGEILLARELAYGISTPDVQRFFNNANSDYYATVDWALDISEASFADCDIRGVPASLVRRDPYTQVVVKRQKAIGGDWRTLDFSMTYWDMSLKLFLERGDDDVILVAPRLDPNFKDHLVGLNMLREIGVAEPD